jgi:3alpha(or 20beta)-hydroxysteroid dehydrogenase
MNRLDGKIAIITGGARGMGASHAKKCMQEGAKVVITDILEKEGSELAEQLGKNVRFMKHDVVKMAEWQKVIAATEETFGPINVLVNNAGIAAVNSIEDTSEEEYRRTVDINQLSVFLGMKAVLPSMRRAGSGSIVNISSIYGLVGARVAAYTASKFGVRGLTKAAAIEFGEFNIRVNSVHPGVILTPMSMGNIEHAKPMLEGLPLRRPAQPEEVSNLIVYLASDEASYSTGSEFIIDGGLSAQ